VLAGLDHGRFGAVLLWTVTTAPALLVEEDGGYWFDRAMRVYTAKANREKRTLAAARGRESVYRCSIGAHARNPRGPPATSA